MGLNAQLVGTVRRGTRAAYTDGVYQGQINGGGDLLVAQGLPAHTELVRLGTRWSTSVPTANAFNSVAGWPTTRAELVLSNGENYGGKCLVIDTVWAACVADLAAASGLTVLAQISNAGVALATDNTALKFTGSSGKIYNGKATKAIANTAFAVTNKWTVIGQTNNIPTATIGAAGFAEVLGRFIVVPGATLALNVAVSTVAATSMIMGVDWYELAIDYI